MKKYYLLGMWLGDGSLTFRNNRKNTADICLVYKEDMRKWIQEGCNEIEENTHISEQYFKGIKTPYYQGNISKYTFCLEIDKIVGHSKSKHLPVNLTFEQFEYLLSGFIDADGTVDKNSQSVYLMNTDINIIEGFEKYFKEFDIRYSKQKRLPSGWNHKPVYFLRINNSDFNKLNLQMQVKYKKDAWEDIKRRSQGRTIVLDKQFIANNEDLIKKYVPKSSAWKLIAGKKNTIKENYYVQILNELKN